MSTATAQPAAPDRGASRFGPKRVLLLVFGSLLSLLALALLAGGGAAVWGLSQRDDQGYFSTGINRLATPTYALSTSTLHMGPDAPGWVGEDFAKIKLEASSAQPVFLGIGPAADVQRYLGQVAHRQITDFDTDPFRVTSHAAAGSAKPPPPGSQSFWRVRASGSGTQTIVWPLEQGKWSAVAMNADGSRNVSIALRIGARASALRWLAIGLFVGGGILLLLGGLMIYLGGREPRPPAAGAPAAAAG